MLGAGGAYITMTSSMEAQQAKMGRFRVTQILARAVGPFIGFLFLALPSPTYGSSDALKTFNWYTIPGWLSAAAISLLCLYFAWAFVDPTRANGHLVDPVSVAAAATPARRREFLSFFVPWTLQTGLVAMLVMAQFSNYFGLMAGQFHQIWQQSDVRRVGERRGGIVGEQTLEVTLEETSEEERARSERYRSLFHPSSSPT